MPNMICLRACLLLIGGILLATPVESYPYLHDTNAISMNFGLELGIAGKSSKASSKSSKPYSSKSGKDKRKKKGKKDKEKTTDKKDKKGKTMKCTAGSCPENQSCDATDDICKDDEMLVPCISVIDEDDTYFNATFDWTEFRSRYPYRPFCLLVPIESWWSYIGYIDIPVEALEDPNFRVVNVTREDYGNTNSIDNWFELCGLGRLDSSNVRSIGLLVDQSGSMTKNSVANSYNMFIEVAATANLTVCEVFSWDEDWITPFDTSLTPNSGLCNQAQPFVETMRPTRSPSLTSWPTYSPTLSAEPNICLTKPDPYRTCFQRASDPDNDLIQDTILREQYNKGALKACGVYTPSNNESIIEPFTAPYVAADEELTNGTAYLSLMTAEWLGATLSCDEQLELEEVLLEWLKDNVGGQDSFTPVCAFIDEHYIRWLFGSATDKNEMKFVTDVLALKIDFVFVSKSDWLNEQTLTSAKTCSRRKQPECCTAIAANNAKEKVSRKQGYCDKNCGNCPMNKKKQINRQMSAVGGNHSLQSIDEQSFMGNGLNALNLTGTDLNDILVDLTSLDPIVTGALVDATDLESLAICSASHYNYTEYGSGYYVTCEEYENANCIVNDYTYEEGICRDDIRTSLPTFSPTSFPTFSNSFPTTSPSPTFDTCYYTGYK